MRKVIIDAIRWSIEEQFKKKLTFLLHSHHSLCGGDEGDEETKIGKRIHVDLVSSSPTYRYYILGSSVFAW